jgi:hypothetical protein
MTADAPRPEDRDQQADQDEFGDLDEAALDAELAADEGTLGVSLRALLDPPEDIERRTADNVDRSLHGRSALSIGMDLLGLGWRTMTTILSDDPPRADGVPEGNGHED